MDKQKKIRILHLLSQRPDSTGSGIYLQAMLREASAMGHSNFLVAGIQSGQPAALDCIEQDQCMFVSFLEADISYDIVGMSDVMPYKSKRFCDLSVGELNEYEKTFSKKFVDAVNGYKPDIIHSHHLWMISSLARQLFPGIPMVTTCHGSDLRQFQNCTHLQERVLKGCRNLDAVMALSRAQKNDIAGLHGLPPEIIHVVGAGYNDILFAAADKPDPEPVELVYAGKLSRAKGVPWLLNVLLKMNRTDWKLHLVGGGSGEENDQCLMLANKLGEQVQVYGAVSQKELAGIMKRAHVFILPSFYEGLPLVVLEALASGCRIIVNDLPGVKELLGDVQEDYISLVKTPRLQNMDQPYDEDIDMFERRLLSELEYQIGAAIQTPKIDLSAIQHKIDSFSWPGIFRKVRDVYFKTLGDTENTEKVSL